MKVFIGWSGGRSQAMGLALREWLPLVLHYVEPWLSEEDIAAGDRWAPTLAQELETSNFGIICVTQENVATPWIQFEAGCLARSMEEGKVIPLLLDLEFSAISGPLAQFQAKKAELEGIREVIQSINRAASQSEPDERVTQLFEALWPQIETRLTSIPEPTQGSKPIRPQSEILEELVASIRSLDSRLIEDTLESNVAARSRAFTQLHPMMLRDLGMSVAEGPTDPIRILVAASGYKDELPWLYELAADFYRTSKSRTRSGAQAALRRLQRAVEIVIEGPFSEVLGIEARGLRMLASDLDEFASVQSLSDAESPSPSLPGRSRRAKGPDGS